MAGKKKKKRLFKRKNKTNVRRKTFKKDIG